MRKRFRVVILAAVVAAAAVPMGLALTVDSRVKKASAFVPAGIPAITSAVVTVQGVSFGHSGVASPLPVLPDSLKLFGMGAVLFGLAAGVKRAVTAHSRSLIPASEAYNRDVSAR